jgi:hypothetical protein
MASSSEQGSNAANSSPPIRPERSVNPQRVDHDGGEQFENLVARRMAEAVVDRLEMVDVEDQHRHRATGARFALNHPRRRLREAAAIEHAGQRIHRRRRLGHGHRALRDQHEDDEHGADRVEHKFDREQRHPDAAGEHIVMGVQQIAKQDRQHQRKTMRYRHRDRRPALLHCPAALEPQFGGGQRRINRNDTGADRQTHCGGPGLQRHDHSYPGHRPENQSRQTGLAAVEHARCVPDHAAGHETNDIQRQRKHLGALGFGLRPCASFQEKLRQLVGK